MFAINKENLEHLARLARIELNPAETEKLLRDLGEILAYFTELQNLDTANVAPATGGTHTRNIFREDETPPGADCGTGRDSFPQTHDGYLKVPPVFQ